jgi:CheY-like chemotaxis protein
MTNKSISIIMEFFHNEAVGVAGGERLLRSIDDFRELLSPLPAPAAPEEFELLGCVREIVEIINLALCKPVFQLRVEARPLHIKQDRKALEQVLTRVLHTAGKLTAAGEALLSVGTPSAGMVRLSLEAIEAEPAALLCSWLNASPEQVCLKDPDDVFFAVALMVSGKRLLAMGGEASVSPACDGRSVLTLDIPLSAKNDDRVTWGGSAGAGKLNILVAEDNDESFDLTQMLLQDERVWRAHDGQDALQMVERQRFDLVFMDVHMPGMNGYAAIRKMREWETQTGNARTPIVVLSSDDVETQHQCAAECGCSGFLRKPLHPGDLAPLMQRLR